MTFSGRRLMNKPLPSIGTHHLYLAQNATDEEVDGFVAALTA
jgi:hypothetical protein